MKAFRIVSQINIQLRQLDNDMRKRDADVMGLLERRETLLRRKEIAQKYLYKI